MFKKYTTALSQVCTLLLVSMHSPALICNSATKAHVILLPWGCSVIRQTGALLEVAGTACQSLQQFHSTTSSCSEAGARWSLSDMLGARQRVYTPIIHNCHSERQRLLHRALSVGISSVCHLCPAAVPSPLSQHLEPQTRHKCLQLC